MGSIIPCIQVTTRVLVTAQLVFGAHLVVGEPGFVGNSLTKAVFLRPLDDQVGTGGFDGKPGPGLHVLELFHPYSYLANG